MVGTGRCINLLSSQNFLFPPILFSNEGEIFMQILAFSQLSLFSLPNQTREWHYHLIFSPLTSLLPFFLKKKKGLLCQTEPCTLTLTHSDLVWVGPSNGLNYCLQHQWQLCFISLQKLHKKRILVRKKFPPLYSLDRIVTIYLGQHSCRNDMCQTPHFW